MKFRVTLPETGAQLAGDMSLPPLNIGRGPRPDPAATARAVAQALIPDMVRQFEPLLPPAAAARKDVRRNADGQIVGTVEHPATPSPSIRAQQIAEQLASSIAPEYATAIAAKYVALDAAQAKAATAQRPAPRARAAQPTAIRVRSF